MDDNTAREPIEDESNVVDFSWFTVVPLEERIVFSADAPLPGGGGGIGSGEGTAPHASNDAYTTAEDNALAVDATSGVLTNDFAGTVSTSPITAQLSAGPANGALTLNADGSFDYTPNLNFFGTDSFQYVVNQGGNLSVPATVNLTIDSVDDTPIAGVDTIQAYTNGVSILPSINVGGDRPPNLDVFYQALLDNDSDPDGGMVFFGGIISSPTHGLLGVNSLVGGYAYTPDPGYTGLDSFTYLVNATDGSTAIGTVNINVDPSPLVAITDQFTSPLSGFSFFRSDLTDNDYVDGSLGTAYSFTLGTPEHGFVTPPLQLDGQYSYSPDGFTGVDTFTYRLSSTIYYQDTSFPPTFINNGVLLQSVGTVTVNVLAPVNQAPVAVDDSFSGFEDTQIAGNVLANDSDVDSPVLTAALVAGPANGVLALNSDGSFTYMPNANFNGSDSFTYRASDGTLDSGIVTVALTIDPVNDNPITNNDSYNLDLGSPLGPFLIVNAQDGVLANDSDVDSPTLTALVGEPPAHGLLQLASDGSFSYIPNSGFQGIDTFTYQAYDGVTSPIMATVTINVLAPVNQAPVAVDDSFSGNEDTQIAGNVLANDSDVDSPVLTAALVAGPAHGSLALNADGSFTYMPNANFNGSDSFTYKANDGALDSGIVTVALTIDPVNDPPVAADDTQVVNLGHDAIVNVLANDSDVDGNGLTVTAIVSGPAHGTAVINADHTITYQNDGSNNLTDSLTYQISDGQGDFATAIVHFTIVPVVEPPVLVFRGADNQIYIEQHKAVSIVSNVKLTDPNAVNFDGGNLTVSLGENGTLTDRLTIIEKGKFFVDANNNLFYKGQIIGQVAGGDNLNALVISFNNRADAKIVGQLISQIGFHNSTDDVSPLTRRVDFQLNNGAGGISDVASRHIYVRDVNDPPQMLSTATGETVQRGDLVEIGAALGLQITDPDNDSSEMYVVTLHVNKGALSIPDAVLDSLSSVIMTDKMNCRDANGREITFIASLHDTNIILQNLMYQAQNGARGYTDTLRISIRDIDFDDFYQHAKTITQSYSIKVV